MRNLVIALALFGVVNQGLGQERVAPVVPVESRSAKIEHMLKAAEHLEAGGLTEDAGKIRQKADQEKLVATGANEPPHALAPHTPIVLFKMCVMELSRTKMDQLGFSLECFVGSRLLTSTDPALQLLDSLRKDHLVKVLSEPTIVMESNRPSQFRAGRQVRVAVPQGNGHFGIEDRNCGTQVDMLPVVLADQTIHLKCRIEMSQLDPAHSVTVDGETVPGLESLVMDGPCDSRPGQTIFLCGPIERRVSSGEPASNSADGSAPKEKENVEHIQTIVLLTPEIVATMVSQNAAGAEWRR